MNKLESVWDYPRPPKLEKVTEKISIIFNSLEIVSSINAKRILETSHPPVYYIPEADVKIEYLFRNNNASICEWKGKAVYYDIKIIGKSVSNAAWLYPDPVSKYSEIKNQFAFYANDMDACYVGDEKVKPQPGNFYGGWITANIKGPFKGEHGTMFW